MVSFILTPCEICRIKIATQSHHRFPQYKRYRKLYKNIIDESFNIQKVCIDCHLSGKVETWNEKEFIEHALEEGYRVQMPKSLRCNTFK
jgi:RecJ-like exonuclease